MLTEIIELLFLELLKLAVYGYEFQQLPSTGIHNNVLLFGGELWLVLQLEVLALTCQEVFWHNYTLSLQDFICWLCCLLRACDYFLYLDLRFPLLYHLLDLSLANVVHFMLLFLLQISLLVGSSAVSFFLEVDFICYLDTLFLLLVERIPVYKLPPKRLILVEDVTLFEGNILDCAIFLLHHPRSHLSPFVLVALLVVNQNLQREGHNEDILHKVPDLLHELVDQSTVEPDHEIAECLDNADHVLLEGRLSLFALADDDVKVACELAAREHAFERY